MKKNIFFNAFLVKTTAIIPIVAIMSITINAQAQGRSYINKTLGVSYLIPDNFTEAEFTTKNSVLRLKSIEEQTVMPDEVVIVDDCSPDRTVQIVEEYASKSKLNIKIFEIFL